jgi:hypothetical protein
MKGISFTFKYASSRLSNFRLPRTVGVASDLSVVVAVVRFVAVFVFPVDDVIGSFFTLLALDIADFLVTISPKKTDHVGYLSMILDCNLQALRRFALSSKASYKSWSRMSTCADSRLELHAVKPAISSAKRDSRMCKEVRDWGLVHVAVVFISLEERFEAVVRRHASTFLVGISFIQDAIADILR